MRFAIFTVYGESLPVALHLQDEGNEVHFGIVDDLTKLLLPSEPKEKEDAEMRKKRLRLGEGLIKNRHSADELAKLIEGWDEGFVFCDFNSLWPYGERLKKTGLPGIYPTKADREFEVDREKAKEFVKANYPDLTIGDADEYESADEAITDLDDASESHVLKGNAEGASAVVPDAKDNEVANGQLQDVLAADGDKYEKGGFLLEKKIEDCVELTPEMWFMDGNPIFASVNIETKRLSDGEIGPMTGCSSGLVFPVDIESEICDMAFPKAVYDMAKEHGGLFIWDASIYFDPKDGKAYFGEFCPNRAGYDCLFGEIALCKSASAFFEAVTDGNNPFEDKIADYSATVGMFMLKPSDTGMKVPEDVAMNPPKGRESDFWPLDAYADKEGQVRTLGMEWQAATATGTGNSPKSAIREAHMNAEMTDLRGKTYRSFRDIADPKSYYSLVRRYEWGKKMW